MKHEKIKELLPLYIDSGLTAEEKEAVKKHLKDCSECKKALQEYQQNYNFISNLAELAVPEGFKESILKKAGEEMKEKDNRQVSLFEKIKGSFSLPIRIPAGVLGLAALVLVVFISTLPGLLNNGNNMTDYNLLKKDNLNNQVQYFSYSASDMNYSAPESNMRMASLAAKENTVAIEQKIIKRANLVIEKINIDEVNEILINLVESHKGYISNSRNWLNSNKQKHFWFEIRVPADNFGLLVERLSSKEFGQLISSNISSQDVTEEYMDLETRLKNLLAQEERYRNLLDMATEVEEILKIENELNRIRTEVEILQGRKNYLDNQISYSTITVEFRQPEPISSGTPGIIRALRNAVSQMIEQVYRIIIFIGTLIPYLILILILYLFYRSRKRRVE
ncbi:MAG: DUF4349 domain-containing protein [Halanaerobiaceae bacterium]|nr:DUF4349 domain-containing protein [Halanaerobiaceae bacterium]